MLWLTGGNILTFVMFAFLVWWWVRNAWSFFLSSSSKSLLFQLFFVKKALCFSLFLCVATTSGHCTGRAEGELAKERERELGNKQWLFCLWRLICSNLCGRRLWSDTLPQNHCSLCVWDATGPRHYTPELDRSKNHKTRNSLYRYTKYNFPVFHSKVLVVFSFVSVWGPFSTVDGTKARSHLSAKTPCKKKIFTKNSNNNNNNDNSKQNHQQSLTQQHECHINNTHQTTTTTTSTTTTTPTTVGPSKQIGPSAKDALTTWLWTSDTPHHHAPKRSMHQGVFRSRVPQTD